jgi:hypothetical protein
VADNVGKLTHVAYADETQHNIGRFRGIGLISLRYGDASSVGADVQNLLRDLGISEFKWSKLNSRNDRDAACKMLGYAIKKACAGVLRADVLTWDIQDRRHMVRGRDDIANLQRMYYHLFKNVLRVRWPDGSIWQLCPDEQTSIKWREIQDFLNLASSQVEIRHDMFSQGKFSLSLKEEFGIKQIVPCPSCKESLVQLADLFAGLAAYSRNRYDRYELWQHTHGQKRQLGLFPPEPQSSAQLSHRDHGRCHVLATFDAACKRERLGVGLKDSRGLKTYGPSNPINFWWYEPQHEEDRAPTTYR